jgi:hypothetical protein
MSCTVILGGVYLTHQSRSSLSASICHDLVIKFTSSLLKPTGGLKLNRCRHGCDFLPTGVTADRFEQMWPRVGTHPTAIPSLSLPFSKTEFARMARRRVTVKHLLSPSGICVYTSLLPSSPYLLTAVACMWPDTWRVLG